MSNYCDNTVLVNERKQSGNGYGSYFLSSIHNN